MKLLIASLALSALTLSQAWADQILDQLLACRRLPDPAARLECFDHGADAASTAKPSDDARAPSKPAAIESSIVEISQPMSGRAAFTLENGQVWRQVDADNARSAKIGDRVVVSKAFSVGSYWLRIEGGHAWRVILVR